MSTYDILVRTPFPAAIDDAWQQLNQRFSEVSELLRTDLTCLEWLPRIAFLYTARDNLIFLNRQARRLRRLYSEPSSRATGLSFTLGSYAEPLRDDADVLNNQRPKHHLHELIHLNWGKTWLRGSKYPVQNRQGLSMALLFIGTELGGGEQIRQIRDHLQEIPPAIQGDN